MLTSIKQITVNN